MPSNENLHYIIENDVLPRIARRLKKEGLILSYDKEQFNVASFDEEVKSMTITPDLVLHCSNGDKILVEVANPEDPKRLLGEIVYPAILRQDEQIQGSIVFVIGDRKKHSRSLTQRHIMSKMLGRYSSHFVSYPDNEDAVYGWLKKSTVNVCGQTNLISQGKTSSLSS